MRKSLKRYLIVLAFGLGGAVLVMSLRGAFETTGSSLIANISDSFTIPGAILVAIGGLLWVSSDGFFDMLSYGLKNGLHALFPVYRLEKKSFYDYKVEKMEKREKGIFIPFLVIGLSFLLISVIFFVIYSSL